MSEPVYKDATLFIVYNEEGDVTADDDRDTAIERMNDNYGGAILRVIEMKIKVPRPKDYLANLVIPEDHGELVPVTISD